MTDTMPDLNLNDAGTQCFPRWQYPKPANTSDATGTFEGIDEASDRIDNISDTALRTFRKHYKDDTITKEDIFDYVYGVLHAPSYREEFANDLSKMIPRIPYAPDFTSLPKQARPSQPFTSITRPANNTPWSSSFRHPGEPQTETFSVDRKSNAFRR